MKVEIRPLAEISRHAADVLIREIGGVDTLRFLNQFRTGSGDYTTQRGQWLDGLSLENITSAIKAKRGKLHG